MSSSSSSSLASSSEHKKGAKKKKKKSDQKAGRGVGERSVQITEARGRGSVSNTPLLLLSRLSESTNHTTRSTVGAVAAISGQSNSSSSRPLSVGGDSIKSAIGTEGKLISKINIHFPVSAPVLQHHADMESSSLLSSHNLLPTSRKGSTVARTTSAPYSKTQSPQIIIAKDSKRKELTATKKYKTLHSIIINNTSSAAATDTHLNDLSSISLNSEVRDGDKITSAHATGKKKMQTAKHRPMTTTAVAATNNAKSQRQKITGKKIISK